MIPVIVTVAAIVVLAAAVACVCLYIDRQPPRGNNTKNGGETQYLPNDPGEHIGSYAPNGYSLPEQYPLSPQKIAGYIGEELAGYVIFPALREGDLLFRNLPIEWEGRRTELDYLIVNRFGAFIIEVKNYRGFIQGDENDSEWLKHKTRNDGTRCANEVKNPIRQVKREIFLLSRFLNQSGVRVWVRGNVYLLEQNSPVISEYVLADRDAIDRAIHTPGKTELDEDAIRRVVRALSPNSGW